MLSMSNKNKSIDVLVKTFITIAVVAVILDSSNDDMPCHARCQQQASILVPVLVILNLNDHPCFY